MSIRVKRIRSFLAVLLSILMVLALPGPRLVRAEETPLVTAGSDTILINNQAYGQYWTLKKLESGRNGYKQKVDLEQPWLYKAGVGAYDDYRDAYVSGNSKDWPDPDPPLMSDAPEVSGVPSNKLWNRPSVSNIGFSVMGAGTFSFEYRATPSPGKFIDDVSKYNYFAVKINDPLTTDNIGTADFKSDVNQSGPRTIGSTTMPGWLYKEITITEEDLIAGQATIYMAYVRLNDNDANDNYAAIANVAFYPDDSDEVTLTLGIEGHEYGSVKVGEEDYSLASQAIGFVPGKTVSLTAVPGVGNKFYGWKDANGKFIEFVGEEHSFVIVGDESLTAVFAPEDQFVARNGHAYYTQADGGLAKALDEAEEGDLVRMLADQTLSENISIPSGVKLYVPYREEYEPSYSYTYKPGSDEYTNWVEDEKGYADGYQRAGSYFSSTNEIADDNQVFRTLTINEGVTLEVEGTLLVGSVIGHAQVLYQGHTSGMHGKVVNDGDIVVKAGGVLDCFGMMTGNGKVTVESQGAAYEPFMVLDFAGGMNSLYLYAYNEPNQSPFKQYAMQNIRTELKIQAGGTLFAHTNLFASSGYNKADAEFVGTGGLFRLAEGGSLTRTFNPNKTVGRNPGVGVMTYSFDGGMDISALKINVIGNNFVSTANVDFPIPQTMELVLKNGTYNAGRTKLMPGTVMKVESDAHLEVTNTLYVFDGLIESPLGGNRYYPDTGMLQAGGFSGSGSLIVDGSMTVRDGAKFGGLVQTNADAQVPASIVIENGALVANPEVIDGGHGNAATNTSIFALSARAWLYDSDQDDFNLVELEAGHEYWSYADTQWTIESYQMKYAVVTNDINESVPELKPKEPPANTYYKWEDATVTLGEQRTGSWSLPFDGYAVNVTKRTTSNPNDDSRAEISVVEEILKGQNLVFTLESTEAGAGYVHLVTYTMGLEDPLVLSPVAGKYTISDVQGDLSIQVESRRYGDLVADDTIDIFDLIALRQIVASGFHNMDPMTALVTDFNQDGEWNVFDLIAMRIYIASGMN